MEELIKWIIEYIDDSKISYNSKIESLLDLLDIINENGFVGSKLVNDKLLSMAQYECFCPNCNEPLSSIETKDAESGNTYKYVCQKCGYVQE